MTDKIQEELEKEIEKKPRRNAWYTDEIQELKRQVAWKDKMLDKYMKTIEQLEEKTCGCLRPTRKTFCQLNKGHTGSHRAVIYWESHDK